MMWRWWILLAAACALCSCAGSEAPRLQVQRIEVPVAVRCAGPAPTKPDLVDGAAALTAAPNIFGKTKLLLAGRAQRDGYIAELEASRSGCD